MWNWYFAISLILYGAGFTMLILEQFFQVGGLEWGYDIASQIASLMAVCYLAKFGTFLKSKWRNFFIVLGVVFMIANAVKQTGSLFSNVLATVPVMIIGVIYTNWFFRKAVKYPSDFLKMLWLNGRVCYVAVSAFDFYNVKNLLGLFTTLLLLAAYIQFKVTDQKKTEALNKIEWDFDKP